MSKTILVTGGTGTLGKALQHYLTDAYYVSSTDYNLTDADQVKKMYRDINPDTVIHTAALVGGIIDNISSPADYFYDNIMMDTLMVKHAIGAQVEQFIGILSTCAYPDVVPVYPMTEETLHDGPVTPTNLSYGFAKRALAVHIDAANKQYGSKYNYLIPCNLYSGNNYKDENKAHFLDTLISKIRYAKRNNQSYIPLIGTGRAMRQFMLADDIARVIKMTVDGGITESFNVCPEENLKISDLVKIALKACDATDLKPIWNMENLDGQLNKHASNARFRSYFPDFAFTQLEDGIRQAYKKNDL